MQTKTKDQVYAGFFVRLAAFIVDMIIVNAGLLVVRIPKWIYCIGHPDNILVRDFIFKYSVYDIMVYLITVAYFVLFTYRCGATPGKKLFQLRVVSVEERDMTWFEVLYRETIGRFLAGIIMNIGYLMVFVEKDKRGLHDILSDTCVVYYHEKKVYVHAQMNYRNMAPQSGYTSNQNAAVDPAQSYHPMQTEMPARAEVQNVNPQNPYDSQQTEMPEGSEVQNVNPQNPYDSQQTEMPEGSEAQNVTNGTKIVTK